MPIRCRRTLVRVNLATSDLPAFVGRGACPIPCILGQVAESTGITDFNDYPLRPDNMEYHIFLWNLSELRMLSVATKM